MAEKETLILAVGDVFLERPEPESAFEHVAGILSSGDIVFGNSEGAYAIDWERAPSSGAPVVSSPDNVPVLAQAGFNVMSLANNHILDGGYQAMLSTRKSLQDHGIRTAGVGENAMDARQPAWLKVESKKVAVLAYSSVFPHGYEARPGGPGLAPIRVFSHYVPWELNEWNPGLIPKIITQPHEGDLANFREDVKRTREQADIVIVSLHVGDFTRPYVLHDYERQLAQEAIDCGADIILSHHHHLLRGVDFYKNKPIFYGLGHFAFDLPNLGARLAKEGYLSDPSGREARALARRFGEYRISPREDYPLLPFHEEGRLTMIAAIRCTENREFEVGVVPCILGPENKPIPVRFEEEAGKKVLDYLQRCCDEEDLAVRIEPNGMEIAGFPAARIVPNHQ